MRGVWGGGRRVGSNKHPARTNQTNEDDKRRGKERQEGGKEGPEGSTRSKSEQAGGGGDPTRDHPTTDLYPQGTENGFFVANTAEGQPSRQEGPRVGWGDPGRGNGEIRGDESPQGGRGGRHPKGNQRRRPGRRSGEGLSRRDAGEGSQKLGRGGGKRWPCLFRREKSPSRRGSPHACFPESPRGLGPKRGGPRRRSSGP